jgi:hypothetical protein
MTQEIIDKAKALLAAGYNMNQVAAMLMIDRVALSSALITPAPVAEKKTTKKVETTIEPMFEEEEGL